MHCVHVILTHFTHNSDSHGFHGFSYASCMSKKNSALFLTLPASDTCSYEVCLGTYSLVLLNNAVKAWERLYCNLIVLLSNCKIWQRFCCLGILYMCVCHRPEKHTKKNSPSIHYVSCMHFVPISLCLILQQVLTHFRLRG